MKKKDIIKRIIVVAMLFTIFFMVPYNHDEWAWGTDAGIRYLRNFFQGYNGRYFGDILSLLITRSNFFKAFFMTVVTLGVYLSIKKFYGVLKSNDENREFVLLCTFLLLLMVPTVLFRQIYGWPAAFVNFVPPVIFVILYLQSIYCYVIKKQTKEAYLISGILISLGTQFFSENVTIFMLVLSLSILVIEKMINKKNTRFVIGATVSALLGTIVMFVNPAYLNAANNTDGYKKIELSFSFIWNKISSQILPNMILNYKFLFIIFNLGLLLLCFKKNRNLNFWSKSSIVLTITYFIYGIFFYGQMKFSFQYENTIVNLFSIAYFISLLKIFSIVFSGRILLFNLIIFISIPFSAAPLIMAEPIGPRSFFLTYCLFILFTGIIYFELLEGINISKNFYRLMKSGITVSIVSMLVFYLFIFGYMYKVQLQRENLIEESIKTNKTEIVLPILPNGNYTWKTSAEPGDWLVKFKKFYGIPADKNVIFK
ncbi:hypothetical protein ACWOCJ_03710 [Enterococcus pseudoavium]|uniref:hypothetical protein n=1 Tax=Enterococcus pseudoavium TaxID=44007 RepID=UPI000830FF9A|nr:hypothetical protein [Enterococcus pseudoavium]